MKIYKEVQRWSLNLQFKFGLKVEVKLEVSIRSLKLKIKVEVWSCIWILSEYLKLKFEVDIDNLKKIVKRSLKFIFYADIYLISIHVNIWLFSIWGGGFLPFWGNWGLGSTTLLWPSYVGNQLWFWKYSPIISIFDFAPFLAFLPFLGLSGLFFGLWSGSKSFFGTS